MSQSADVVVIGGGVNGASTAFHLAQRGVRTVLLERTVLAGGATGKSGALVRMHYTNPYDAALAQISLDYFLHWADVVGSGDPAYRQTGAVRLVDPGDEDHLRANVEMLQSLGVNTRMVSPEELREIDPCVETSDINGAAWEPDSGYAEPAATAYSFATAARNLGAGIHEGVEVTAIETNGDRVTGVATSMGRIATETVVAAPGAWANRLLQPLGLDYGLISKRDQVSIVRRTVEDNGPFPVYLDGPNNIWLRPEGEFGALCGVGIEQFGINPDFFDETISLDYIADARLRSAARRPILANTFMRGGWAGVFMMSPDGHAIIDNLAPYAGLFGILGDSGTNFKTAPAIGKCVAEWITDGTSSSVDLRPFRATRFAEGKPMHGEHEYGTNAASVFH